MEESFIGAVLISFGSISASGSFFSSWARVNIGRRSVTTSFGYPTPSAFIRAPWQSPHTTIREL
jgi:hypothetical protein